MGKALSRDQPLARVRIQPNPHNSTFDVLGGRLPILLGTIGLEEGHHSEPRAPINHDKELRFHRLGINNMLVLKDV